ncbi:MAG: class I SAM-dependent methyltransferase [Gemmatimonadetes bacterium]|nr:class I SAM-dependent methyltransferase [Gemmatimonadota bacterium]
MTIETSWSGPEAAKGSPTNEIPELASLLAFSEEHRDDPRFGLTLEILWQQVLDADPGHDEARARVERYAARREALDARHAEWFAALPSFLVKKVNGSKDRAPFLRVGQSVAQLLAAEIPNLAGARHVLDFGVGLSRVLWPLSQALPEAVFTGFDVDPGMLHHSRSLGTLPPDRFVHTTRNIPDGSVDATYVISVFTHLGDTTDYWLSEIHRMLSPRGHAFVTYHDETLYADLRAKGEIPRATPATCVERVLLGPGVEGSTQLATFYSTAHWETLLRRFFVVEKTAPRGLHGNQSYSVVRKRDVEIDRATLRAEYLGALEDELFRLREAKKLLF